MRMIVGSMTPCCWEMKANFTTTRLNVWLRLKVNWLGLEFLIVFNGRATATIPYGQ